MLRKIKNVFQQLRRQKQQSETPVQTNPGRGFPTFWFRQPRDLPPFSHATIHNMLMDGEVRLALAIRAAPIYSVDWEVSSSKQEVATFVQQQLDKIWNNYIHQICRAQVWGWCAAETIYSLEHDTKRVQFERFEFRKASNTKIVTQQGQPWGVQFLRLKNDRQMTLPFPQSFFHAHDPEDGEFYGGSALFGAYSPWADKWIEGGGLDVRRLFMHKDAYGGVDLGYPEGETYIDGRDDPVPNRDIARQIVEQIRSGNVVVRPSDRDANGNEKWPLQRATIPANPQHILQYTKDLDDEISIGIGVPPQLKNNSHSWAGARIPMAAFYGSLDSWVVQIGKCLRSQIFEPLVLLNEGKAIDFGLTHRPLAEEAMEQQSNAGSGGNELPATQHGKSPTSTNGAARSSNKSKSKNNLNDEMFDEEDDPWADFTGKGRGKGWKNQKTGEVRYQTEKPKYTKRMSLDMTEAVGQGVLDAAELVKAAKQVIRLSADRARAPSGYTSDSPLIIDGKEYKGGEFIPDKSQAEVDRAAQEQPVPNSKAKQPFVYPDGSVQRFDEHGLPLSEAEFFDAAIDAGASPREAADDSQSLAIESEYEFARESSIPNAGEDLKGSARHRLNAWKGLTESEKDGSAEKLVTRDTLLKLEPHNLMETADTNPVTSLAMHYSLRSFPAKPGTGKNGDFLKDRQQFFEAFQNIKARAENIAENYGDDQILEGIENLREFVSAEIKRLRGQAAGDMISQISATDRYNQTANDLTGLYNKLLTRSYRIKKTSVAARVAEFLTAAKEKYGDSYSKELGEHVKDVIDGKSLNATFGKSGNQARRFNPAELYVNHAVREGGKDVSDITKDPVSATKHMVESLGFKGVQWGNSVTDSERTHHAAKAVEAWVDLSDILGIRPEDVSLDGKLGLAFGARGKGNALAHYEPGTQVINLTRKSGVGALAHEWGHAFDHAVNGFGLKDRLDRQGNYRKSGDYLSVDLDTHEVTAVKSITPDREPWKSTTSHPERFAGSEYTVKERPLRKLREAFKNLHRDSKSFRDRLKQQLRDDVKAGLISKEKAAKYWSSNEEVFARSFERHIQSKLEQSGRKNTYLSGLGQEHPYWPTNEEVAGMASSFDAIFAAYRVEKYGSSDPIVMSLDERREIIHRMAMPGTGTYKYGAVMLPVDSGTADAINNITESIDEADLENDGKEDWLHVTVKYGLVDADMEKLTEILGSVSAIDARLDAFDVFENDEHDVLIIKIESDDLHELNSRLSMLPHVDSYSEYRPHITIAYLKPGRGQKYVDKLGTLQARSLRLTKAVISLPGANSQEVELANPTCMSWLRAPKGGVTIDGKFYPGGQFISNSGDIGQPIGLDVADSQGVGFASPNIEENLTFDQALQNLDGDRHQKMKQAFENVDAQLGLTVESRSIIGDWGDGAEDSVLLAYSHYQDIDELRYAMAWKGLIAEQKAVLLFEEQNNGEHKIYSFEVDDTIKGVRKSLSDYGIEFRSIEIGNERPRVVIVDLDQTMGEAITKVAGQYNVTVEKIEGQGEFIGVDSERTRSEAHAEYQRIIEEYEEKWPDRKRYREEAPRRFSLDQRSRRSIFRSLIIGIGLKE